MPCQTPDPVAPAGTAWLGIDGGGTGCRAVVADRRGIIGRGEAGPANIHTDPDGACAAILSASAQAAKQAGLAVTGLDAVLGLAGANMATAVARLAPQLPFRRAHILSDAVTATRGALGWADGIMAAMGTGSVFVIQQAGRVRQFGGHGMVLGDEGGGAPLGRAALAEALRAEDGFAPASPYLSDLIARFGDAEAVVWHATGARPADFAALLPDLLAAADAGDPGAERLLAQATDKVADILESLQARAGGGLPVVFMGGLGPTYAARLAGRFDIRPAQGTALAGALILARELARGAP